MADGAAVVTFIPPPPAEFWGLVGKDQKCLVCMCMNKAKFKKCMSCKSAIAPIGVEAIMIPLLVHVNPAVVPDANWLCGHVRALLIVNTISALGPIAARSYVHANNQFVKIPLMADANTVLRMHIWLDPKRGGPRCAPQNPHSHGWAFQSRIIRGSFTHRRFALTAIGDSRDNAAATKYRRYEIDLVCPNQCTKARDCLVEFKLESDPAKTEYLFAGQSYSVNRTCIHTLELTNVAGFQQSGTNNAANGGITLVRAEKAHDDVAYVYSPTAMPTQDRRPALTVDELRRHLHYVMTELLMLDGSSSAAAK